MLTEADRDAVLQVALAGGYDGNELDWAVLSRPITSLSDREKEEWSATNTVLMRGFLNLCAEGHQFVPAHRIKERFGKDLADNYPEASPEFLRFATAYWTLKLWIGDHAHSDLEALPMAKLAFVAAEQSIGPVFFPTPGPVQIDPAERERTQRGVFGKFGTKIDVESFMAGNPILLRDRQGSQSGCLGAIAVAIGATVATVIG